MDKQQHPYQRLGGWLLFFVVGIICGIIFQLIVLPDNLKNLSGSNAPELLSSLLLVASLVCNVLLLVFLFRRDARFLLVRQIGLAIGICASAVLAASLFDIAAQVDAVDFFDAETIASLQMTEESVAVMVAITRLALRGFGLTMVPLTVFNSFLVMLYYSRSVRVRTYMGSADYLRRAVFTRKANPQPAVPDETNEESVVASH